MAVNLVSSSKAAVQQTKTAKRSRTGNAGVVTGSPGSLEEGRLLKDLVAVLASSRHHNQPDTNKAKPRNAICNSSGLLQKCVPDSGDDGGGGGELHLAIASLNAASKEFSTLAEKMIAIAGQGQRNAGGHTNNHSNNTTVNEKEKTENRIYKEIDDITLADSKTPSPVPWPVTPQKRSRTGEGLPARAVVGSGEVATDNNVSSTAAAGHPAAAATTSATARTTAAPARNEVIIKDCTTTNNPRGSQQQQPPPLEEKLDKLLDSVVKIKVDMHQKIDRLSRRVDQMRLDVKLNIDSTDRAVCNNVLELAGVPYRRGENLQLYFRRICELLGYAEADIPLVDVRRRRTDRTEKTESCTATNSTTIDTKQENTTAEEPSRKRNVAEVTEDNDGATTTGRQEPAVITIEFIFKTIRDTFYRAYLRKRTAIRLTDLGLESDRRVYINESLTARNQKLKSAALRKKREGLLHAVYTVDGAVYVQQQPGQKGRRVNSVAELD